MKYCTNCGSELNGQVKFCSNCGSLVVYREHDPPVNKKSHTNKTLFIVFLSTLSIALLIVVFNLPTINEKSSEKLDNSVGNIVNYETTKTELLTIPKDQARDIGDWTLEVVVNRGAFGIRDQVNIQELIRRKDVNLVLIVFWATWCDPAKASMPHLEKIYQDYKDKGLTLLGACRPNTF
jgi:thiol-disulfide isomerase/thioredoxin